MKLPILVTACVLVNVAGWRMPESWSAAAASVNKKLRSFSGADVARPAGTADLQITGGHAASGHKVWEHSKVRYGSGEVLASELGIVHKTEYWGKIYVGSPAKEFSVIFDTGSGNLILPSTECESAACNTHKKYGPSESSTAAKVGKKGDNLGMAADATQGKTTIKFGTGKIHGSFWQDQICLGDGNACMKASFIGTDYESDMPFESCSFDGIMGLGFSDLSMGVGFNMVDDITAQHTLPKPQFSVYLTDDGGSEISFGGYKRSQAASEMVWAPVTRQSYWQIGIDDVTFNNKKTGLCSNCQVAVDTGTSLLAGPSEVVQNLGTRLNLKDDCSNFHTLPLLGFSLGDKEETVLNLTPDDYIDRSSGSCSLALMTLDVPPPKGPLFIFGDPFLRRFLTVYDREGPRVGFAVAQHEEVSAELKKKLIAKLIDESAGVKAKPKADEESEGEDAALVTQENTVEAKSWSPADDLDKLDKVNKALASPADSAAPPAAVWKPADTSLLRGNSKTSHVDMDADPLDAIDNENLSWGSIFKALQDKKQKTGMLQTVAATDEGIVTISLARTSKATKKK